MLTARFILLVVLTVCVGTAISEDVGRTDLEADRIGFQKSRRSLLDNNFDLLTQRVNLILLQVEELKRNCYRKDNTASSSTFPCGGTTYVRWGRTACPENGTELVYKGYMAGSPHTQTGNGPNNLCLPEDPTWAKYKDGTVNDDHRARVYGTEYKIGRSGTYTPFSPGLADNDVPCAVCRTTRSSSIMIPGRTNCYSGWTVEYSGYLVSANYGHASPIEYVCLDGNPESIDGGIVSINGHLIYLVDVKCGALRCPPYVNGRELACVVCSK